MVICLARCADLHMAQQMPLPLTVPCFSKIQIGFTFLVPAHPGSPGHRAVERVCVRVRVRVTRVRMCVCVCVSAYYTRSCLGPPVAVLRHITYFGLIQMTSLRRRVQARG